MSKEVEAVTPNALDAMPEDVRNALALIGVTQITEAVDSEQLTGGWRILKDKNYLVGKPFFIVKMGFNESEYSRFVNGEEVRGSFVTLHILTDDKEHDRFVLVDGSTGIKDSCESWVKANGDPAGKMIRCARGLRVSNYDYKEQARDDHGALVFTEDGSPKMLTKPASTFYFD